MSGFGDSPPDYPVSNCGTCGTPLSAGVRFCRSCGAAMVASASAPTRAGATPAEQQAIGQAHGRKRARSVLAVLPVLLLAGSGGVWGVLLIDGNGNTQRRHASVGTSGTAVVRATRTVVLTTKTVTATTTGRVAPESSVATPRAEMAFPGAAPDGRDAHGYNIGPGCSDDPESSLPGCDDAPTVPGGDPPGTCPNRLVVDSLTTTCSLAENVYNNYTADGIVTAFSPERGRDYAFTCRTGGAGTTAYRFCLAKAGPATLYVRWPS